jgi:hypothetical protein
MINTNIPNFKKEGNKYFAAFFLLRRKEKSVTRILLHILIGIYFRKRTPSILSRILFTQLRAK